MASYDKTTPSLLTDTDFSMFGLIRIVLPGVPCPAAAAACATQGGESLGGTSEEDEGRPWPTAPPPYRYPLGAGAQQKFQPGSTPSGLGAQQKQPGSTSGAGTKPQTVAPQKYQPEDEEAEAAAATTATSAVPNEAQFVFGHGSRSPRGGIVARSLQEAIRRGETLEGWDTMPQMFPGRDALGGQRTHEPMPFKLLKELKEAVAKYGPSAPYTSQLLKNCTSTWPWTPTDWKDVAQIVLTPGQYVTWEALQKREAELYIEEKDIINADDAYEMLTGTGQWKNPRDQNTYHPLVFAGVAACAVRAFSKLEGQGESRSRLTGLKQRPNENPTDFVSRVQTTVQRLLGHGAGTELVMTQIVKEGLRGPYQKALAGLSSTASLAEVVDRLLNTPSEDPQLAAMAKAIAQGVVSGLKGRKEAGNCFRCGKPGHYRSECRSGKSSATPTCYSCGKPGHIAKYCRNKLKEYSMSLE